MLVSNFIWQAIFQPKHFVVVLFAFFFWLLLLFCFETGFFCVTLKDRLVLNSDTYWPLPPKCWLAQSF